VLSDQALARALERAGLRAPVRFDEVTRSTQAAALALAADGAPEWTLVAAGHQTAGRGRLGRTWTDDPGRALMFSFVLRPELDPARGGVLSLLAGLAVAEACDEAAGVRAACKWPNDVLLGGRKAAGVLAESSLAAGRIEHVVVGIGVNLGSPPEGIPGATAVDADAEEVLGAFFRAFAGRYRPSSQAFAVDVLGAYRDRCATLGAVVRARTTGGDLVEGEAVDVDEHGGLVVRTPGGVAVVRFGEAEHLE
jgi:BirA family biotin operon repressor/biotin-[acetyl-CoA-carboxylase] ligase